MSERKFGLDAIVAWAKRKGFVYPGSDIYWGLANAWDYGPYGSQLKKNISDAWRKFFVIERDDMVGFDTAILAHPQTWVASWHVGTFGDFLIDDKKTGQRFRPDKLIEDYLEHTKYKIAVDTLGEKWAELMFNKITSQQREEKYKENLMNTWFRDEKTKLFEQLQEKYLKENNIPNYVPESWWAEKMYSFITEKGIKNPDTKKDADRTPIRKFNLMLSTHLGVIEDDTSKVYMRPETCQSLFTNFRNLCDTTRVRIPFGMAQIGKSFRNEITPGQFLYRTREFEQMEIEYFVENNDEKAKEAFEMRKELSMHFRKEIIQFKSDNLRFREHEKDELSHYSRGTFDVEYNYPWWWGELQGIANRGDFDLTQHQNTSGKDLQYKDPYTGDRYLPYVIEPSFGLSRTVMAVMLDCYDEEEVKEGDMRVVVRFPFAIAPVKYAVFPLMEKDEKMAELARKITHDLKKQWINVEYDGSGNIGKRYRRQDEIGTPYCITVDHDTINGDGLVTIRHRDSMAQERIAIADITQFT